MKKILSIFAITSFTSLFSQITINSTIPSSINSGSSVDAEIKINKGTIGNFAKYQMDVPTGYAVSSVDVKGGNFTFENQRAKIVWVSVPSDPEFSIKLKIQANSNAVNPATFSQKYFYLENNEKKEVEATPVVITLNGGNSTAAVTPVETKSAEVKPAVTSTPVENKPIETKPAVVATPVENKPVETKPVETISAVVTTPVESKPVVETKPIENKPVEPVKSVVPSVKKELATPTSQQGITYRVQVGSFGTQPAKSKFAELSNVSVDIIDGTYKVTTGKFNTKEEAIKHRDAILAKGFKGFIVTFNGNTRIK